MIFHSTLTYCTLGCCCSNNVILGLPLPFFFPSTWINSLFLIGALITLLYTRPNHLKRLSLIISSIWPPLYLRGFLHFKIYFYLHFQLSIWPRKKFSSLVKYVNYISEFLLVKSHLFKYFSSSFWSNYLHFSWLLWKM